jgi:hypothetical protein
MPDNATIIKVETRRELKAFIDEEAKILRDAGYIGANKKAVAWLAAESWREAQKPRPSIYDNAIPLKQSWQDSYFYGLFVSVSTRADYLGQEA